MATYYITTSIPYVNATPHLGFALELVQADAFARHHRLRGDDVRFVTGTDENSLTNVLAAEQAGVPVGELVDKNAEVFRALGATLGASNDDFIRTARDERHRLAVERLWRACDRAGDLYKKDYRGLYCVRCERFYAGDELVDGLCPVHGIVPEFVEEENYFFRLSRYADRLLELYERGALRVIPAFRQDETLAFLRRGLEDISVSRGQARARGWGIPVPDDPSQVVYVWFDALVNYISALGYGTDDPLYRRYWLENPRRVHVIGKDIVRFHAVYWPAMLLAAGEPPPTTIFVHGFLTNEGQRMSKTLGTGVDPTELVADWGTDAVRYWLLREVPPTGDADYSAARLVATYNADLADDLGNLLSRVVSMVRRYRDGIVPSSSSAVLDSAAVFEQASAALDAYDPRAALAAIWSLVAAANRHVDAEQPWALAKAERAGDSGARDRLDGVLGGLCGALSAIAEELRPLLPETAARIEARLAGTEARALFPKSDATSRRTG